MPKLLKLESLNFERLFTQYESDYTTMYDVKWGPDKPRQILPCHISIQHGQDK